MERVLEPEYMDTPEDTESYAAMDHEAANRSVSEFFLAAGGGHGMCLDIGTGPGDIPLLIAELAPEARIVAVDAAATMLRLAQRHIADRGLRGRVLLQLADAKQLPLASDSFDGVLSNTILHHIPEPRDLLAEAWRVVKPGGVVVIRDLCRPRTEADAWALVDRHAKAGTPQQRQLLFDSLHASLTLDEAAALVTEVGMTGARVDMTSDRHYTIVVKEP